MDKNNIDGLYSMRDDTKELTIVGYYTEENDRVLKILNPNDKHEIIPNSITTKLLEFAKNPQFFIKQFNISSKDIEYKIKDADVNKLIEEQNKRNI